MPKTNRRMIFAKPSHRETRAISTIVLVDALNHKLSFERSSSVHWHDRRCDRNRSAHSYCRSRHHGCRRLRFGRNLDHCRMSGIDRSCDYHSSLKIQRVKSTGCRVLVHPWKMACNPGSFRIDSCQPDDRIRLASSRAFLRHCSTNLRRRYQCCNNGLHNHTDNDCCWCWGTIRSSGRLSCRSFDRNDDCRTHSRTPGSHTHCCDNFHSSTDWRHRIHSCHSTNGRTGCTASRTVMSNCYRHRIDSRCCWIFDNLGLEYRTCCHSRIRSTDSSRCCSTSAARTANTRPSGTNPSSVTISLAESRRRCRASERRNPARVQGHSYHRNAQRNWAENRFR